MADSPPQQQQEEVVVVAEDEDYAVLGLPNGQEIQNLKLEINGILNTPIVEVRQDAADNEPPAVPYINLAQHGQQYLAIADLNIPVEVRVWNQQRYALLSLINNYRVRGRPVVYETDGQPRHMVDTNYPTNNYGPMFTYGLCGWSGPQAELVVNANRHCLLVIDQQTAIALRNQCVSRADQQSLICQLVRSAHQIAILSQRLYEWSAGNDVDDQHILTLRATVYLLGNRYIEHMRRAVRSKSVYLKAIVREEAMDLLPLDNPAEPLTEQLPLEVAAAPDIGTPNMQQSVARITAFVNELNNHPMFNRNWQQTFNAFASLDTSVPIVEQEGQIPVHLLTNNLIRLSNNHQFWVSVWSGAQLNNNVWIYTIRSPVFNTETIELSYHVWPVVDLEPFQVMRCTNQYNFLPVHSHGLAGSYYENAIQGGNNGFQVTTINFSDVPGLDHRRLYFVNRLMATNLKNLFEILNPNLLTLYHGWIVELIHVSRLLCDLRQWYRGVADYVDDDQWLTDIQNCSQLLLDIPGQLFGNYRHICRLEQIWHHSLLVPNIQGKERRVQNILEKPDVYLCNSQRKSSDAKRKSGQSADKTSGSSSGLATSQKKQKTN